MKKTRILFPLLLLLLFLVPASALAFSVRTNSSVYVGADEVIEGNLYIGSQSVTIDGTVNGDVICGAMTVNINGKINGDVICGANTININGEVDGNVRVAGESINLNNKITRNVMAFGTAINLGNSAEVGGEMFMAGAFGDIRGKVAGDLHGAAANIVVSGEVGKNIRMKLNNKTTAKTKPLTIKEGAIVGGNVVYTSGMLGEIMSGAQITGEVKHSFSEKYDKTSWGIVWALGKLISIFSALVIGLVLISLWREDIEKMIKKMKAKTSTSIGWGVVIMFLTPIASIILLFTLIGIPLSIIIIALWLIALYISKIFVGILLGNELMEKFRKKKKTSMLWSMIVGVTTLCLVCSIPVIGWTACLVAMWWGLGGIFLYFKDNK